jgi:hypothetical protein
MIVDSSAILAIAIEGRAGVLATDDALLILGQLAIETLPFDAAHMHEAQRHDGVLERDAIRRR